MLLVANLGPFELDTIVVGDCLDVMRQMPDGCVDAVITDPPYGIGFDYPAYDDSPDKYEPLMRDVVEQLERISDGAKFVWQTMLNADKWHRWFPEGFRLFAACKGFVQFRPTPIQYSWDPVVFWGNVKGQPSVGKRDYHVQRKAPFGAGRPKIDHPCPRPVEQVMYVIDSATDIGDTIFDPFMGSGTTAVAAKKLGRHYFGCDINSAYVDMARARVAKVDGVQLELPQ